MVSNAGRRDVIAGLSAAVASAVRSPALPALAEDFDPDSVVFDVIPVSKDKMSGLLESYTDLSKGWRIMKPYGKWLRFCWRRTLKEGS